MARDFGKSKRAEEFRKAISDAGMHLEAGHVMAQKLDISYTYFRQLWEGSNPLSAPIRHKLEALMAAKADGPAEVETVDVALMQNPHPIDTSSPEIETDLLGVESQPRPPKRFGSIDKYVVLKVEDGYAVAQNFVAVFRGVSWAEEYADWLNEQIRRGKEGV